MQKQLITDQLIEEYQKELDSIYELLTLLEMEGKNVDDHKRLSIQRNQLRIFITSLQSLRQQEVDNVIEAYGVAKINVLTNNVRALQNGNDYFTQTFEQKGGGQSRL